MINTESRAPLFSIIIPTHNRAHLIERTLNSIFCQTLTDFEVLVIDDASTDDTQAVLVPYVGRIRILHNAHQQGEWQTRNNGLREARGRYAIFVDSDDLLFPWAVATYKEVIERFDSPALMIGNFRKFQDETELASVIPGSIVAQGWDDYLQSALAKFNPSMAFAMRMDIVRKCEGFIGQNHVAAGEQDLFLRAGTAKGFVYVKSPVVYAYRQHSAAQSRYSAVVYRGARLLLARERDGTYPGGPKRALERSVFLARVLKFSVERCLGQHGPRHACELYLRAVPYFRRTGYWPHNKRPFAFIRGLRRLLKQGPRGMVERTRA